MNTSHGPTCPEPSPHQTGAQRGRQNVGADYTVPVVMDEEEDVDMESEEDLVDRKAQGGFQRNDKGDDEEWGSPEHSQLVEMDVSVTDDFTLCLAQTSPSPLKEKGS